MARNPMSLSLNKECITCLSKQKLSKTLIALFITTSLTACGGGGGGGTTTTPVIPVNNSLIPVTYPPFPVSTISGTKEQQTVINAQAAWDLGYKGQGITIGVVDSGVNPNHIEFYDDNGNTRINWSDGKSIEYILSSDSIVYTNDYRDIDSPDYHGTHVSSIALGREYGVAPEATLLPVNVFLDNSTAYNIAIHEGANYIASKAPIVNASISGMVNLTTTGGANSELNAYLNTLQSYDVALVNAAGNGGIDGIGDPVGAEHFINYSTAQNLAIQAGIENQVLSAIALNDSGSIASFSNYPGSCSDVTGSPDIACDSTVMSAIQNTFISVPGVSIEAAYGGDTTSTVEYSGTSMATPVVSGSLAVLLSGWNQLTIQQAVDILKTSANNTGVYSDPATYGVGLLDLQAAMTPLGTLKSSSSTTTSYNLGESSVTIPSSLSGLSSLSALKSVAYFDDYNRDFLVDITPAIQIEKTPISWNRFWANSQPGLNTETNFANLTISANFDYHKANSLKNFALYNDKSSILYAQNSSSNFIQSQFAPLTKHFYANNQQDFGNTFAFTQALTANLSIFSSLQEKETPTRVGINETKSLAKLQSVGLNYQVTPHIALNLTSQLRDEQDSLLGMQGSGAFSFGESNLSQINTFALQYSHNGMHIFGQIQNGQLLESNLSNGSYINVKNAELGQLKLGIMRAVGNNSSWGLQTYNYNTLLHSDINLTLPTGMSADGTVESQTVSFKQKRNLNPDTIELFVHLKTSKQSQLQLNAINNPDDSGVGISLYQTF
ncbi:S8 family serine peptidase [Thiomicrorhabdus sp. Kp2]|uniref:S8 family peptidase n=1 Tax=Thiomicrorhabdus sp. Kp2 TaxID=1123518 RepID=UPI0012FEB4E2|nr:S8 family serine peptidase [Thiomicrorhabdus sp. Kp2]